MVASAVSSSWEYEFYYRMGGWWCSRCYDLYGKQVWFRTHYGLRMHVEQQHEDRQRWRKYRENEINRRMRALVASTRKRIDAAYERAKGRVAGDSWDGPAMTSDRIPEVLAELSKRLEGDG